MAAFMQMTRPSLETAARTLQLRWLLEVESARGMIARFDAIEQLAAGSMAARRGSRTARSTSGCAQGQEAI
jgi:hypothetical protein